MLLKTKNNNNSKCRVKPLKLLTRGKNSTKLDRCKNRNILAFVNGAQCDQIWRNFTTWQHIKSFEIAFYVL